jgi:hypothetical protein
VILGEIEGAFIILPGEISLSGLIDGDGDTEENLGDAFANVTNSD